MLGTLRFRLTALFLMVVLVFGLVSIALAIRLFQDVTRTAVRPRALAGGRRSRRSVRGGCAPVERRGNEGARIRGARTSSSRPATSSSTSACRSFRGSASGLTRLATKRARRRGSPTRRAGDLRVHATGRRHEADRRRAAGSARSRNGGVRLARRREAGDRASRAMADPAGAPRARARSRGRPGGTALLVALPAAHGARPHPHSRDPGRRRRSLRRRDPGFARQRRDLAPQRPLSADGRQARRGRAAQALVPDVGLARAAHAPDRDPRPRGGASRGDRHRARAGAKLARRDRVGGRPTRTARRRRSRSREAAGSPLHGSAGGGRPRDASSTMRTAPSPRRRAVARSTTGSRAIAEPPVIVSDGDRVLQVISNLLSNAFRWTPDGGRIELELAADNGSVRVDVG